MLRTVALRTIALAASASTATAPAAAPPASTAIALARAVIARTIGAFGRAILIRTRRVGLVRIRRGVVVVAILANIAFVSGGVVRRDPVGCVVVALALASACGLDGSATVAFRRVISVAAATTAAPAPALSPATTLAIGRIGLRSGWTTTARVFWLWLRFGYIEWRLAVRLADLVTLLAGEHRLVSLDLDAEFGALGENFLAGEFDLLGERMHANRIARFARRRWCARWRGPIDRVLGFVGVSRIIGIARLGSRHGCRRLLAVPTPAAAAAPPPTTPAASAVLTRSVARSLARIAAAFRVGGPVP